MAVEVKPRPPAWHRRWRLGLEGMVVIGLLAASLWYGRFAFLHALTPPDYYYLAPAVMVASGQGFRDPAAAPGTPLAEFLARRVESLAVADARPASLAAPDAFQSASRYLLLSIGYWWRITGISWTHLADVSAALHAITVLGGYALLRLFVPIAFALLGGLWLCTSTLQLSFVPHVRDYSKAAFIVAALPLIVVLALRARSRQALLAASAAAGAVIGIGFGFRMDTAVMAPLAVMALLLFRAERPWRGLAEKGGALAVFLVCLAIPAWPVASQLAKGGSNESHVALLGYADAFDTNLEVDPAIYRFMPFYSDSYVANAVSGYANALGGPPLTVPSPEYAAATRKFWLAIVGNFPSDVYTRAVAAASVVMNLVFHAPDPSFLDRPMPGQQTLVGLYTWLHRFSGAGAVLGVVLIVVASAASVRQGLLASLLIMVLAGYPSLQFSDRHYFHVQVVPVFALLVLAWLAINGVWRVVRRRAGSRAIDGEHRVAPMVRRLAVGVAIVAVLTVLPMTLLRAYQAAHVGGLIAGMLAGPKTPIPIVAAPIASSGWFAAWPEPARPVQAGQAQSSYYVLEFNDDGSGAEILVGLRYASADPAIDYSRVLSLTPRPGVNRLGFSVLTVAGQSSFSGIEMGDHTRRRLAVAYQLAGGPAALPLDLRLPGDWEGRPRFQRLGMETSFTGDHRAINRSVVCATGVACRGLLGVLDRIGDSAVQPDLEGVIVHSPIVAIAGAVVTANGIVENDSSYLVQMRDRPSPADSALVAAGHLDAGGGVVVGLLKERRWYGQAFVTAPGNFLAIVPVAEPGDYATLVTNAMPAGRRLNRLTFDKIGFLDPLPP